METPTEIEIETLPPKREMIRVAACIVAGSLACGLLLGAILYGAPDSAVARVLADTFVRRGIAPFQAPGAGLLALGTGLVWGLGFIFLGAFPYTGWLIHRATSAHKEHVMRQKMDAHARALGGKQKR